MLYRDRAEAGRRLGEALTYLKTERPVVLGLPRGGVAVGFEVARTLDAPLDVLLVRKVGVPFQPELAMGALGEGGVVVVNEDVVRSIGLRQADFVAVQGAEQAELERRAALYRAGRPPVPLADRVAVLVDDGVATGSTARAACQVARAAGASRVVLAVPVGPPRVGSAFADVADEVVCLARPVGFLAIGEAYVDFSPTTDAQVIELLARAGT
jgi:putative phosphoribosyl transferase